MNDVSTLLSFNAETVLLVIFALIFAFSAIIKGIETISSAIGKPVKWIREKENDHQLVLQTSEQQKEMHEELVKLTSEMCNNVQEIKDQIAQFTDNRIHDREQSFEIQKELTDNIQTLTSDGEHRNEQISNLTVGVMELLGDKIDRRFDIYLEKGGIPANEVDEFNGIYEAYRLTGGNSTRKYKHDYVVQNMKVIPVEKDVLTDMRNKH